MFTAALFTKAKRWKPPNYPSSNEWINNVWHIHTMELYSAINRKEALRHATMGMNLKT